MVRLTVQAAQDVPHLKVTLGDHAARMHDTLGRLLAVELAHLLHERCKPEILNVSSKVRGEQPSKPFPPSS